jgi:isopentenyldiphosphate isomerase
MSGFSRHVTACNRHCPENFLPFVVDGYLVGRLRHDFVDRLRDWPQIFRHELRFLGLQPQYQGYAERTQALAEVMAALVAQGEHPYLMGEPYPVTPGQREQALFEIDRTAASLFGLRTFGQHLNGLVRDGDECLMWVAQRAEDKRTFPGMWDQMVAGGLPIGLSLAQNLKKECEEEASISADLAAQAQFVGAITYNVDNNKGFKYDILYCYDLELPPDFEPRCQDGEVAAFHLMPLAAVAETVRDSDRFKPNCNLVVIDFLLRHGLIGPQHPEYLDLLTGLRPAMQVPEW